MSRLTALVPGSVCAAALRRSWPDDLDGRVRCLDEGTRALGLAHCCAPWPVDAENAALRAELGGDADLGPGSAMPPMGDAAAGPDPNQESFAWLKHNIDADFVEADAVAAALTRVPAAPPVMGLVSGPLTWSIRVGSGAAMEDAVDAAADLASARIRALAGCGVGRVAVIEDVTGAGVSEDALVESHRPLLNAAAHLRVELVLVANGPDAAEPLGYEQWVSGRGCSPGLGFLPREAFVSELGLRHFRARGMTLTDSDETVTAPLEDRVSPHLVRMAAGMLARSGPEATL